MTARTGIQTAAWVAGVPISGPAVGLLLLNLFDALATLTWVELDVAREANPGMAVALRGSPLLFMLVKMALVQGGTLLLASQATTRVARGALWIACTLYGMIDTYHLAFLARLIRD